MFSDAVSDWLLHLRSPSHPVFWEFTRVRVGTEIQKQIPVKKEIPHSAPQLVPHGFKYSPPSMGGLKYRPVPMSTEDFISSLSAFSPKTPKKPEIPVNSPPKPPAEFSSSQIHLQQQQIKGVYIASSKLFGVPGPVLTPIATDGTLFHQCELTLNQRGEEEEEQGNYPKFSEIEITRDLERDCTFVLLE